MFVIKYTTRISIRLSCSVCLLFCFAVVWKKDNHEWEEAQLLGRCKGVWKWAQRVYMWWYLQWSQSGVTQHGWTCCKAAQGKKAAVVFSPDCLSPFDFSLPSFLFLLKGHEVQLSHRAVLMTEELLLPSLAGVPIKLSINMTSLLSLHLKGNFNYRDTSHFSLNGHIRPEYCCAP